MWHSTKRYSSIFDLGPLTPKIFSPKLLAITLHYHVATCGRALGTAALPGESGDALNFVTDPCCHGNEIWPRRGDLDAYRLVDKTVYLCSSLCTTGEQEHCKLHDTAEVYTLVSLSKVEQKEQKQRYTLSYCIVTHTRRICRCKVNSSNLETAVLASDWSDH